MKVLQVNSVCGYGSTGNIVVDLYHALREQGHDCCIAYGRGNAPDNVQSYRIGSDIDVYVHGIFSRITDKHAFYSKKATKRFVKWMKDYDPDVIHLHNLHGYYINIEILFEALKQMDKLVVWTLHDCWAFTGHCAHYTKAGCYKWMSGCGKCPQKKRYPSSVFIDNSCKNYANKKDIFNRVENMMLVTPSQWLADEVQKSFLSKFPRKVIYNGVDLSVFQPTQGDFRKKHHLEDKKIILGVANVWNEGKGLYVFDELVKKLDNTYKIVLVGIAKNQRSQVDDRILCLDRTGSKQELAGIYSTADLFLNPSVEETMGLTTVEALACGTNVLVRNSTALPEIVEYNKEQILPEDDICEAVKETLKEKSDVQRNRISAFRYEKREQYMKYVALYNELKAGDCI